MDAQAEHPLRAILCDALAGQWPADDGGWTLLPSWRPGLGAVVAFTGHAYVCTDRPPGDATLDALGCDGYGGATLPPVLTALAGGWIDCLDVLLAARGVGRGDPQMVPREDLADHPRVRHARLSRESVRVLGYADPARRDLATVGSGLAGLPQIGVEATDLGVGSALFADLLATLPDPLVLAGIAPGNARSLRSALRAGFTVLGSVQLFATGDHGERPGA